MWNSSARIEKNEDYGKKDDGTGKNVKDEWITKGNVTE